MWEAVQLQQLSDLGVAISIDDSGTGFSFLSYVKRLPVRALVCGRHIFGRHFPFRVAEDARARGGSPSTHTSRASAAVSATMAI
jgi:membrane-associated phospholipid phosphatase